MCKYGQQQKRSEYLLCVNFPFDFAMRIDVTIKHTEYERNSIGLCVSDFICQLPNLKKKNSFYTSNKIGWRNQFFYSFGTLEMCEMCAVVEFRSKAVNVPLYWQNTQWYFLLHVYTSDDLTTLCCSFYGPNIKSNNGLRTLKRITLCNSHGIKLVLYFVCDNQTSLSVTENIGRKSFIAN